MTASFTILSRVTTAILDGVREDLLEALRADPGAAAVLCDVDGTLAPIVEDPADAAVPEDTRETLRALAGRYALVACITGRPALEARSIVGVEELTYAGNHGFELLGPGEREPTPDPAVAKRAEAAATFMDGLEMERLGAGGLRREDKGAIQALHWRGAADEDMAVELATQVAERAEREGLHPRWGRKVLELRPLTGVDKGSATMRLVEAEGARSALFGGDDRTDLDAFAALRELVSRGSLERAVCVGVESSEQPPGLADESDLMVRGPEGFRGVLEVLL